MCGDRFGDRFGDRVGDRFGDRYWIPAMSLGLTGTCVQFISMSRW
jgi:hypothetical protein